MYSGNQLIYSILEYDKIDSKNKCKNVIQITTPKYNMLQPEMYEKCVKKLSNLLDLP